MTVPDPSVENHSDHGTFAEHTDTVPPVHLQPVATEQSSAELRRTRASAP
eukprot:CAMPEP_0179958502 /NCGR_PEP_ID=MMETSP0983-20121128/28063_1 /TAXON_ID=483367 /ORGANISM="non described non described, Strain CCMP 2436" /LENGTH=49 /DNA_ID= /DNA_START= /DNA_END= /DNA_ORIENTATION=